MTVLIAAKGFKVTGLGDAFGGGGEEGFVFGENEGGDVEEVGVEVEGLGGGADEAFEVGFFGVGFKIVDSVKDELVDIFGVGAVVELELDGFELVVVGVNSEMAVVLRFHFRIIV